ncbi:homocysteine S-methyltransferase [Holzapfeliella sp. He02]|uniref:Homocysteine S-methyltransferase n=1 Tax=Holzapfeliella saturejae TaxID=3082953 RepID=A0ABU8SHS6_9LACO
MSKELIKNWAKQQNSIVIDGAMSLGLEERQVNLNNKLWTASAIDYYPEKIKDVHQAYFDAGANIAIVSTYQASVQGYLDQGYSVDQAKTLIKRAVQLADEARQASDSTQPKFLAGAVGPYGAYLADGSEYRGDYALSDEAYREFHRDRLDVLIAEGCDLLAIETMPNYQEIKVILELLKELPEISVWVTCTLKDAKTLSDGTPFEQVQALLEENNQVIAYGANCIAPELVTSFLKQVQPTAQKDLVIYPNSGASYSPEVKEWDKAPHSQQTFNTYTKQWHEQGAKWIGGCCCTSEPEVRAIVSSLN